MTNPENGALRKNLKIKVLGVGGAGCNLVNHLAQGELAGIAFAALNTDSQALANCRASEKIVLGAKTLRGFGAGGDPETGRRAACETIEEIKALCAGADIVFIATGLGGGTGTGASPVIAEAVREAGALALGIVTLPFEFEGSRRQRQAQMGLRELQAAADAVICLPNQRVLKIADANAGIVETFQMINDVLGQGIAGIWRMLAQPGLINVDFADLCAVTKDRHSQNYFATVQAEGAERCEHLLKSLFAHPLLENGILDNADALLISICSGNELTMQEVNRLMSEIQERTKCSQVLFGASIDPGLAERISITLIASHLENNPAFLSDEPKRVGNSSRISADIETFREEPPTRTPSRFVPPPPELAEEKREKIINKQIRIGKTGKKSAGWRQAQLPLDIVSRGRFEKSEPTIHQGADLDVPTYIRLGVPLN